MLVIRADQFAALRAVGMEGFARRALDALRTAYPADPRLSSDEDGMTLMRDIVSFATAHGIRSERGVMRLALLEMRLGPRFWERPEHPWAMPVLEATERGEESRLFLLEDYAAAMQGGEAG
jgi:hypothetical protein